MGTMIGDDGGANQIGVAPGAKWIAAYGCCPSNEVLLEAQQWIVAPTDLAGNNPDPTKRPNVVNQSWGGPGGSEIFEDVIAALDASGIFPAFSAGNRGSEPVAAWVRRAITRWPSTPPPPAAPIPSPASLPEDLTHSRARLVQRLRRRASTYVLAFRTNSYANLQGTSMASPHVAGSVALLISLEPKLAGQIDQLEELLRKTAVQLTSAQTCGGVPGSQIPNNAFGWGRIDVKAAADMVYHAGYIQGTVTVGGVPTAGVPVTYSMLGKTLTTKTDASGFYKVIAGAGTWAMTANPLRPDDQRARCGSSPKRHDRSGLRHPRHHVLHRERRGHTVRERGIPAMIMVANQELLAPALTPATDAAGDYSIVVPAAAWNIVASHPGYQSATQNVVVGGNTTLNFQLTPQANYACLDNTQPGDRRTPGSTPRTARPTHWAMTAYSASITLPGTFASSARTTRRSASTRTASCSSALPSTRPPA